MNTSMINSRNSMHGIQQKLDIIANNVANMNTVGYKRQDVSFKDILTSYDGQHVNKQLPGRISPLGFAEAWGSQISSIQVDLSQGPLQATENPFDIAIEGNGLIEIGVVRLNDQGEPLVDANGLLISDRTFTRNGAFQLTTQPGDTENSYLSTSSGQLVTGLNDELMVIPKSHSFTIDPGGNVYANSDQEDAEPILVGQLKVVRVLRPQGLVNLGDNRFVISNNVDNPDEILQVVDNPVNAGISIRQGFLEQSNVNLATEMTELINLQRAYELNARALISSDAMMNIANQLRG